MNTYICTGFAGYYPVGTAAVIKAHTRGEAFELLKNELFKLNLSDSNKDLSIEKVRVIDEGAGAHILCDGDY